MSFHSNSQSGSLPGLLNDNAIDEYQFSDTTNLEMGYSYSRPTVDGFGFNLDNLQMKDFHTKEFNPNTISSPLQMDPFLESHNDSQAEIGSWDSSSSPSSGFHYRSNSASSNPLASGLASDVMPNSSSNPVPSNSMSGPSQLIRARPTPRALKAKRRPTNKCECGGKASCSNPLCAKAVGCHSCPVCGIEFSRKNSMRRHVLTHINLRPYECRDCNKSFYRSDIYKRHLASKRCRRNTSQAQLLALCQQQSK